MPRILVTGGSGFIGSALANDLAKQYEVTIFDNNERNHSFSKIDQHITWIKDDICDYTAVLNAVKHSDIVYNLAYINGTENFYRFPGRILEIAGLGQINVGRAINTVGVEQFIYASSSEAYQLPQAIPTPEDVPLVVPDPLNPRFSYGGGKIFGELLSLHHVKNAETVKIFRPHNVYGPNMGTDHVVPQLVKKIIDARTTGEILIQGSGAETRSFCHILDAIQGIRVIQENGNAGIYHLGSGIEVAIMGLVKMLMEILEVDASIVCGPLARGSVPRRCPDISKLSEIGFVPKVDLRQGLSNFVSFDEMVNIDG